MGRIALAVQHHGHDGRVVHVGVVGIRVLERPATGHRRRPRLPPVAGHVQHLPAAQPVARGRHRRAGWAVRLGHGMRGQPGVPHRRETRLAVGTVRLHHEQLAHRRPGGDRVGVVRPEAERVEHHHRVRHRRVDAAQPVLAVQPLADERHGALDGTLPDTAGQERLAEAKQRVEVLEEMPPGGAVGTAYPVAHLPGRGAEQLRHVYLARVAGPRLQRHQHDERHDDGARPVRHLAEVEREPFRQADQLHRHHRHRAPRHVAVERKLGAGEHVGALGAAGGQNGLAGAAHVRRARVVADHLQREIRLNAGGKVERAVVKQRPAAVRALDGAQVGADLLLQLRLDTVEEVLQQHVFGRNGGVGFQLEHPVPVGMLPPRQGGAGAADGVLHRRAGRGTPG
jgi:hypothetical protein